MKSQIKRLLKSSAVYGLGTVLSGFISLLMLPLLTSFLTPEDYGKYSMLLIMSLALYYIFMLGMSTSIGLCYYDYLDEKNRNKVIFNSVFILIVSSAVMLILTLPMINKISILLLDRTGYNYQIVLVILSLILTFLTTPFTLKLQFEEKSKEFVVKTMVTVIITVLANIVLIVFLKRGLNGLVEVLLISKISGFIMFGLSSFKNLNFSLDRSIQKNLIKLGIPMIPSFLSLYVLQQSSVYILKAYSSVEQAGIFSVGMTFGRGINILSFAFTTAWTPFFLSFINKKEEANKLFGRITTYYIFLMGLVSLCFYSFAKPGISILTDPAFHESFRVVGLITTGQMLVGVFNLLLPPIYYGKKVTHLTLMQVTASLGSVVACVFLTKSMGIVGAALAFAMGYLLMCLILLAWNKIEGKKYLKIRYESKRIFIFTAAYVLLTITTFFDLTGPNLFYQIGNALLLPLVILIVIFFLLSPTEKNILASVIKNVLMGKSFIYADIVKKLNDKN